MKTKQFLIILILSFNAIGFSQNKDDFNEWHQKIQTDDFGDFKNYQYSYVAYDNSTYNPIYLRVRKDYLRIHRLNSENELIKYSGIYILKTKNKLGYIAESKIRFISGKGGLHLDKYSNFYNHLTTIKDSFLKVVIYNESGEKINSFSVNTFDPIFR